MSVALCRLRSLKSTRNKEVCGGTHFASVKHFFINLGLVLLMTHFALSMFSVSIMWTQQRNLYLAIGELHLTFLGWSVLFFYTYTKGQRDKHCYIQNALNLELNFLTPDLFFSVSISETKHVHVLFQVFNEPLFFLQSLISSSHLQLLQVSLLLRNLFQIIRFCINITTCRKCWALCCLVSFFC